MANISHFTQTVNGVSTTYDIHDANAVPRSGGNVTGNLDFISNWDYASLNQGWFPVSLVYVGSSGQRIGFMNLYDDSSRAFRFFVRDHAGQDKDVLNVGIDSTNTPYITGWGNKRVAYQEDAVPRSGGAVMEGPGLYRTVNDSQFELGGGTIWNNGAALLLAGKDYSYEGSNGRIYFHTTNGTNNNDMRLYPSGTWTWSGTAVQLVSDQRLKQQITEIDDNLLDAWEDVDLVQFKYNDAVDQKKDKARLHTGYVVQQIDSACQSHGVDISAYGLYCHEEYPQETEEVEVEQADGTKTKERKVIREASEHYSLRYTEVYAVECMYLRRCIKQLTARIEQLEKGNKEVVK